MAFQVFEPQGPPTWALKVFRVAQASQYEEDRGHPEEQIRNRAWLCTDPLRIEVE